jgi:hypothetical protein
MCPHCHQPLPSAHRWGVYLTPTQTITLDAIRDNPGISAESLVAKCGGNLNTLRQHVHDINIKLEETGVRISGNVAGKRGCYNIVRRHVRVMA